MKFKFLKGVITSLILSLTCLVNIASATIIYSDESTFNAQFSNAIIDDYSNVGYVFWQDDATMSAVLGELPDTLITT